jgi:hypothetical protein
VAKTICIHAPCAGIVPPEFLTARSRTGQKVERPIQNGGLQEIHFFSMRAQAPGRHDIVSIQRVLHATLAASEATLFCAMQTRTRSALQHGLTRVRILLARMLVLLRAARPYPPRPLRCARPISSAAARCAHDDDLQTFRSRVRFPAVAALRRREAPPAGEARARRAASVEPAVAVANLCEMGVPQRMAMRRDGLWVMPCATGEYFVHVKFVRGRLRLAGLSVLWPDGLRFARANLRALAALVNGYLENPAPTPFAPPRRTSTSCSASAASPPPGPGPTPGASRPPRPSSHSVRTAALRRQLRLIATEELCYRVVRFVVDRQPGCVVMGDDDAVSFRFDLMKDATKKALNEFMTRLIREAAAGVLPARPGTPA